MTDEINHPVIKGGASLLSFMALYFDWFSLAGKLCAAATAIYLFGELVWKRAIKPMLIYFDWMAE